MQPGLGLELYDEGVSNGGVSLSNPEELYTVTVPSALAPATLQHSSHKKIKEDLSKMTIVERMNRVKARIAELTGSKSSRQNSDQPPKQSPSPISSEESFTTAYEGGEQTTLDLTYDEPAIRRRPSELTVIQVDADSGASSVVPSPTRSSYHDDSQDGLAGDHLGYDGRKFGAALHAIPFCNFQPTRGTEADGEDSTCSPPGRPSTLGQLSVDLPCASHTTDAEEDGPPQGPALDATFVIPEIDDWPLSNTLPLTFDVSRNARSSRRNLLGDNACETEKQRWKQSGANRSAPDLATGIERQARSLPRVGTVLTEVSRPFAVASSSLDDRGERETGSSASPVVSPSTDPLEDTETVIGSGAASTVSGRQAPLGDTRTHRRGTDASTSHQNAPGPAPLWENASPFGRHWYTYIQQRRSVQKLKGGNARSLRQWRRFNRG